MARTWIRTATLSLGLLSASCAVQQSDWPQYRGDSLRSGYTAETLPENLSLVWRREARHRPKPAWTGRSDRDFSRMRFDHAYQTVIVDGKLFFGSSVDDKVYALDAETGAELWTFFTGGPVRFAPVVDGNRLFVVSDDGCLYCLRTTNGSLIWRFRGGPNDNRVIGNGRIVSRWPARGGPVLKDGIVYFACGIWPSEGVDIYAIDAGSGEIIWSNDSSGALEIGQPHQICFSRSGVASQGYLAATDKYILVSSGRAIPACFDRKTGEFRYFHLQRYGSKGPSKLGDADVIATESVFFNTGYVFDTETGAGYSAVPPWRHWQRDPKKQAVRRTAEQFAITPDWILHSSETKLFAGELLWERGIVREFNLAEELDIPSISNEWSFELEGEIHSLIAAGQKAVVGHPARVSLIDLTARRKVWEQNVDGIPLGLAVANRNLYVSTEHGSIYCFGPSQGEAATNSQPVFQDVPYGDNALYAKAASEILEEVRIKSGYCLDVGCGEGRLIYELLQRSDLRIIGIEEDPDKVATARVRLDEAGVYGSRAVVIQGRMGEVELPQYFANLIVSGRSVTEGAEVVLQKEIERLQRPYGGVLCVGKPDEMIRLERGELESAGQWTHHYGSPANTLSSEDALVRPPFGVLWYEDPTLNIPQRHGKGPGSLFYQGVLLQAGKDSIRAIDAYNGHTLWEFTIPGLANHYDENTSTGAAVTGGIYCVADGIVYARQGSQCHLIDVFTGKGVGRFEAPRLRDAKPRDWTYVAAVNGVLFGGVANQEHVITSNHGGGDAGFTIPTERLASESSMLFAMDAKTGNLKWRYEAADSIRNNTITIGNGTIYFIDREAAEIDKLRRSEVRTAQRNSRYDWLPQHQPGQLLALDATSGRIKWRNNHEILGTYLGLSEEQDVLIMAYLEHAWKISSEVGGRLWAFRGSDGKALWSRKTEYYNPPVLLGRDLYAYPHKYDLQTGTLQEGMNLITGKRETWEIKGKTFGCGPVTGAPRALFNRSGTLSYIDLINYQGRLESYGGIRPGCWIAALPVGGLVLMPDDTSSCTCSYLNQASIALIHRPVRPPVVYPDGAIFSDQIAVQMRSFEDYEIRYTMDGSTPDADSSLYTEPMDLRETTVIRAAVFTAGEKVDTLDAKEFVKLKPIPPLPSVHLSDLKPVKASGGMSDKGLDKFFAENEVGFDRQFDGGPLALGEERFEKGLSALTLSEFVFDLKPEYERFVARVGVGEPGGEIIGGPDTYKGTILAGWATLKILIDGELVHESPRLKPDQPPWNIDLRLPDGGRQITLYAEFDQAGGKEHWDRAVVVVNWANAGFLSSGP